MISPLVYTSLIVLDGIVVVNLQIPLTGDFYRKSLNPKDNHSEKRPGFLLLGPLEQAGCLIVAGRRHLYHKCLAVLDHAQLFPCQAFHCFRLPGFAVLLL